jgi:hypothetical protein
VELPDSRPAKKFPPLGPGKGPANGKRAVSAGHLIAREKRCQKTNAIISEGMTDEIAHKDGLASNPKPYPKNRNDFLFRKVVQKLGG